MIGQEAVFRSWEDMTGRKLNLNDSILYMGESWRIEEFRTRHRHHALIIVNNRGLQHWIEKFQFQRACRIINQYTEWQFKI